jgi:hypothetical protein
MGRERVRDSKPIIGTTAFELAAVSPKASQFHRPTGGAGRLEGKILPFEVFD